MNDRSSLKDWDSETNYFFICKTVKNWRKWIFESNYGDIKEYEDFSNIYDDIWKISKDNYDIFFKAFNILPNENSTTYAKVIEESKDLKLCKNLCYFKLKKLKGLSVHIPRKFLID